MRQCPIILLARLETANRLSLSDSKDCIRVFDDCLTVVVLSDRGQGEGRTENLDWTRMDRQNHAVSRLLNRALRNCTEVAEHPRIFVTLAHIIRKSN